jgi:hypothetical protein
MAIHSFNSSLDIRDFDVETEDQARFISAAEAHGELNVGACRGLALALLLQTVFMIFGCLCWQIWKMLR